MLKSKFLQILKYNKSNKYIINMDNKDGKGTHWVAMIDSYYFDSYGKPADQPQEWNTKNIMIPNLLTNLLNDDKFNSRFLM